MMVRPINPPMIPPTSAPMLVDPPPLLLDAADVEAIGLEVDVGCEDVGDDDMVPPLSRKA